MANTQDVLKALTEAIQKFVPAQPKLDIGRLVAEVAAKFPQPTLDIRPLMAAIQDALPEHTDHAWMQEAIRVAYNPEPLVMATRELERLSKPRPEPEPEPQPEPQQVSNRRIGFNEYPDGGP